MIPKKIIKYLRVLLPFFIISEVCGDEKSSLTFVIDDTYSMNDEINQVKNGVNIIFDTVLSHNSSQIDDFVLVTFNDPDSPILRASTKDRHVFKDALASIEVNGGGLCPELSMGGIALGIQESKPRSTVYVVTDAAAKDYNRFEEVKNMAASKQIQLVFLLTGLCDEDQFPENNAYRDLAYYTVGQVFQMDKDDIEEILNYVIQNLKGRGTQIAIANFPPGTHSVEFEHDAHAESPTVSVAGVRPELNFTGPDGKVETKKIVDLDNIVIEQLVNPKPGSYNATISSSSDTNVLITAITHVIFKHGFSTSKPSSIEDTANAPNPDEKSHVIIKLTDGAVQLKTVKILDMDDKLIKEVPLVAINELEKLYTTELEELPDTMFKVAITGYDPTSGETITRIGPPIKPPPRPKRVDIAPSVSIGGALIPTKTLQLNCTVKGYPKPKIVWVNSDGDELLATEYAVKLPSEFMSTLVIDINHLSMSYECQAENSVGFDSTTYLAKSIPHAFTIVRKPTDTTINYHDKGELHCEVDSYPPSEITWYKDRKPLVITDDVELSADNSTLKIKEMHKHHDGSYLCEVRNEDYRRVLSAKVTITGVQRPRINKRIKANAVSIGTDAVITCKITKGIPRPTITWHFNDIYSGEEVSLDRWRNKETITIHNADESSAGIYSCVAENEIGSDFHEVELTVEYPPEIEEDGEDIIRAANGKSIKILCSVKGQPDPKVTWYKDNVPVTRDHSLRMTVGLKNSGTYTCNATNKLGTASRAFTIYVPPTITLPKQTKHEVQVGTPLNLRCETSGYPMPTTEWIYYSFNPSVPPKRVLKSLGSSAFPLTNIKVEDEGYYTCAANNSGGSTNVTYEIHVNARPYIEPIYMDKNFKAVEGDTVLIIKCNASGNPPPVIRWLKNGYWVAAGDDISIENGTIILKNIDQDAAGLYVCEARNHLDYDRELYKVTVDKAPQAGPPTSTISISKGDSSRVQCDVPHKRIDLLRWYKNGVLIHQGELTITNARVADSGLYTCRVSNFTKSESGNTLVQVGYKPQFFDAEEENIEFAEGASYVLNCEANGDPEPETTWWHNGEIMNTTEYYHYVEMEVGTHGHYKCESRNDFGFVTRSFNIIPTDCLIDIRKQPSKLQPLMTSTSIDWPPHNVKNGFMFMHKNDYVALTCPNRFKLFPQPTVVAYCDEGSKFIVLGKTYEYSDLECTEKVTHIIESSGERCFVGNAEFLSVVFEVPSSSLIAYEVCYDADKNTPVYTTMRMRSSVADVGYSETKWADKEVIDINLDEAYECERQNNVTSTILRRWFHKDDQCCFSKRMLVSPKDLFPGVAQRAAYSDLNVVPHWSTCNRKSNNWNHVEQRVRNLAKATYSELVVSTGVAENLTLVDSYGADRNIFVVDSNSIRVDVPQYMWKVVQDPATKSSLVIIQVNVPDLEPSAAPTYVRCRDICNSTKWMRGSSWYDVNKGFTYCCTLKDFEDSFGFRGVFEPYYHILNDVSLIPGHSLT